MLLLGSFSLTLCLCFIIIIIVKYGRLHLEHTNLSEVNNLENVLLNNSFNKTIEDAAKAVEYLYRMQKNQAFIEPVVETPLNLWKLKKCGIRTGISIKQFYWANRTDEDKWILQHDNLFLFSAYFDPRQNSLYPDRSSVQVIATSFGDQISSRKTNSIKLFCYLAITESLDTPINTIIVPAYTRRIWQRGWDPRDSFYNAFLITCPLPKKYNLTKYSFVAINNEEDCKNVEKLKLLEVYKNKTKLKAPNSLKIAVCVKGLDFLEETNFSAQKVAEWLELQMEFGADSIVLYVYHIPSRVFKLIKQYEKDGKIKINLPGESPKTHISQNAFISRNRQQKRRHELIPYNDCFYRHINSHDFVLIVDTDEIVIPVEDTNWQVMLKKAMQNLRADPSAISIRNVFKFPSKNETDNESFFQNKFRSIKIQAKELYGKSFIRYIKFVNNFYFSTKSIASVFNHFALHRLHSNVSRTVYLDPKIGLKLHFKSRCPMEIDLIECQKLQNNTIYDTSLNRLQQRIQQQALNMLKKI